MVSGLNAADKTVVVAWLLGKPMTSRSIFVLPG
jgi:hypothetical protein